MWPKLFYSNEPIVLKLLTHTLQLNCHPAIDVVVLSMLLYTTMYSSKYILKCCYVIHEKQEDIQIIRAIISFFRDFSSFVACEFNIEMSIYLFNFIKIVGLSFFRTFRTKCNCSVIYLLITELWVVLNIERMNSSQNPWEKWAMKCHNKWLS